MTRKNTLHKLSIFLALLSTVYSYNLDPKCFFQGYIVVPLIFLTIPFLWNSWLYQEFIENSKKPISYSTFIFIGNMVYVLLILFVLTLIFIGYKPGHYIEGVC